MMMWRSTIVLTVAAVLTWAPAGVAGDTATPEEVIAKVREAADYLAKKGKSGLETFNKADSPFVWKDTYVFVWDCEAGLANVAHPVPATHEGKVAMRKDATGRVTGPEYCEAAARPNGGWVEYMWWKPVKTEGAKQLDYAKEISRKVAYMRSVKGTPYQVGAGVHNDSLTVKELDALLNN